MSTGLPRPRLVHSAHRGRIKLLRGYVSKLGRCPKPTHDHACELSMRGRSRTALLGPSHQLAVRLRIMRIIVPRMRTHVSHAPRVSTYINHRRACAARITVAVLRVCVSTTILALQATRRLMSDTSSFIATRARKILWRFC